MSFGRDDVSSLGVSYEPWHWRWGGGYAQPGDVRADARGDGEGVR